MTGILWRDTARPVRIGPVDARVLWGAAVWLVHMSWPTFWISAAVLVFFLVLEQFGVTPPAACRYLRTACFPRLRTCRSGYTARRITRW